MDKESLIKQLRSAVTGDYLPDAKDNTTKIYDASTGTLYCNLCGQQMDNMDMRLALDYFKQSELVLARATDRASLQKANYCRIAALAIQDELDRETPTAT
ncbi:MAG: hypothetical protein LKF52_15355 [Butyrivibrio sp.]|jgi:hypothetical protein|nr:hypothetical protein [Butyrivibrio sp.]